MEDTTHYYTQVGSVSQHLDRINRMVSRWDLNHLFDNTKDNPSGKYTKITDGIGAGVFAGMFF